MVNQSNTRWRRVELRVATDEIMVTFASGASITGYYGPDTMSARKSVHANTFATVPYCLWFGLKMQFTDSIHD